MCKCIRVYACSWLNISFFLKAHKPKTDHTEISMRSASYKTRRIFHIARIYNLDRLGRSRLRGRYIRYTEIKYTPYDEMVMYSSDVRVLNEIRKWNNVSINAYSPTPRQLLDALARARLHTRKRDPHQMPQGRTNRSNIVFRAIPPTRYFSDFEMF